MGKLPAIQFYPGDWRKDVGVQSLSFHDRGVWFEMLMLMHESERRGLLILNSQPMDEESIARLLGLNKQILTKTVARLLSTGVAGRDEETGALMCRRMVRDERIRQVRTAAGKKGGNPVLLNQDANQKPTTPDKQIPTPSVSSSSSLSFSRTPAGEPGVLPPDSADAHILCDTVGIFDLRQQEDMHRCMKAFAAKTVKSGSETIVHMAERWKEYAAECERHEWQYGSAHKFFMSGKWDDPRSWPRAGPKNGRAKAEAEWEEFKKEAQ